MAERILQGIRIIHSRPDQPQIGLPPFDRNCRDVYGLDQVGGCRLSDFDYIAIAAGDGTTGSVFNQRLKEPKQEGEKDPVFVLLGGGHANTLRKGLIGGSEKAEIPEDLRSVFSPEHYQARVYYPPVVCGDSFTDGFQNLAYLLIGGHMDVFGQNFFDEHIIAGKTNLSYQRAGLASFGVLCNPGFTPLKPRDVTYTIKQEGGEEQTGTVESKFFGACMVVAVPMAATFPLQEPIASKKLRLLTIEANSRLELVLNYGMGLVIAAFFPHGPDIAIRRGLIRARDVSKVSFVPDPEPKSAYCRRSPRKEANAGWDGELGWFEGEINVRRGGRPVTIIRSKTT